MEANRKSQELLPSSNNGIKSRRCTHTLKSYSANSIFSSQTDQIHTSYLTALADDGSVHMPKGRVFHDVVQFMRVLYFCIVLLVSKNEFYYTTVRRITSTS